MQPLTGRIAVVAGATRGAGRGIAIELGAAAAVVYCTGRSVRGQRSSVNRPETIEETAEMVTAAGGQGIAVRVDHTVPEEVEALFTRVDQDRGGLDVLVNNLTGDHLVKWRTPFWQLSLDDGLEMLSRSVLAHIITSRLGIPLIVRRGHGLVVEVTDGDDLHYRGNLFYDLSKVSNMRLAFAMAEDFKRCVTVCWDNCQIMPMR